MTETTPLTYTVDSAHSSIRFWVRHLMIAKVHGSLSGITGTVTGHPDTPELASFEITVPLSTFSTNDPARDGHVKSADFLDVEKYPEMTYKSKSIAKTGSDTYDVVGELTLHGVTKEVPLKAEVSEEIKNPMGEGVKVGINATGVVHRDDFGVAYNQILESGGVALGKDIHIEIDLELQRPA